MRKFRKEKVILALFADPKDAYSSQLFCTATALVECNVSDVTLHTIRTLRSRTIGVPHVIICLKITHRSLSMMEAK